MLYSFLWKKSESGIIISNVLQFLRKLKKAGCFFPGFCAGTKVTGGNTMNSTITCLFVISFASVIFHEKTETNQRLL